MSPRKSWSHRICSSPVGIKWRRRHKNACSDFWNKFGRKTEGAMTDSRERTSETLFLIWSLLHWSLKISIPMSLRTTIRIRQNSFKTSRRDNWWSDQVFKDYDMMYVISFISRRWLLLLLFNSFSRQYFNKYNTSRSMSLLEMSIR